MLGGVHAPLLRDGVGPGELGEAEGALLEDGADQEGEVGLLGERQEGDGGVDSGPHAVVPSQDGTSSEGWRCGNSILLGEVSLLQSSWWVCVSHL